MTDAGQTHPRFAGGIRFDRQDAPPPPPRVRTPRQTWRDFLDWWGEWHAGEPLPSANWIRQKTGISSRSLRRFRAGGE